MLDSPVPLYDLTNRLFNPYEDFHKVSNKFDEVPGIEVPKGELVIITFYVGKWIRPSSGETNIDLSLQWVGLLRDPSM